MTGERWRIVDEQGGKVFISTVVLSEAEAQEQLDAERTIHEMGGWQVITLDGDLICRSPRGVERRIGVRKFSPDQDLTK